MNDPLISVITAVFNGENYFREALKSVFAQGWKNLEVIIVDDGSTDQSAEIARTYSHFPNVTYIYQENSGHATALNNGVSAANGEFLAFIDHDDLWEPAKLEIQLQAFSSNKQLDVVFCHLKNFPQDAAADKLVFQRQPIPGYVIGGMVIRKTSFLRVGHFNTDNRKGSLWPWFDALKQKLNMLLLDDVLLHRRVHGENWSICTDREDYSDYFEAIRTIRKQRGNDH